MSKIFYGRIHFTPLWVGLFVLVHLCLSSFAAENILGLQNNVSYDVYIGSNV